MRSLTLIVGGFMFKKILVPTDGSPLSEKAAHAAVIFAAGLDAKIIAISVADPYVPITPAIESVPLNSNFYDEDTRRLFEAQPEQIAKNNLQYVKSFASEQGVSCELITAISADPYEEIVRAVKDHDCDLIFMASHGRKGFNRLILGSEAQKVIAYSDVPVLVYR
jgi:nucleotide-binding universal stress UspA family protein